MAIKDQYLADGSDYLFSLSKLVGKAVVDVIGYPADPYGAGPLFSISQIVFADGTKVHVGGEHDIAYVEPRDRLPNLDEETLQGFIDEEE